MSERRFRVLTRCVGNGGNRRDVDHGPPALQSKCPHGNKPIKASGCASCMTELMTARAVVRGFGCSPQELAEVIIGQWTKEQWLAELEKARARLAAKATP